MQRAVNCGFMGETCTTVTSLPSHFHGNHPHGPGTELQKGDWCESKRDYKSKWLTTIVIVLLELL